MAVRNVVRKNSYYDSVTLMRLSNQMSQELGSKNVAVMMATDTNKEILRETNLLTEEGEKAGPNDLIFAARFDDTAAIESAFKKAEELTTRVMLFEHLVHKLRQIACLIDFFEVPSDAGEV